jgi:hypothetical protein
MRTIAVVMLFSTLVFVQSAIADRYTKCIDTNGNVIYSNVGCPAGYRIVEETEVSSPRPPINSPMSTNNYSQQTTPINVEQEIERKCQSEWPGDYKMQKYCQDRQYEAYRSLTSGASQSGVPASVEQSIIRKCQSEWPGDYRMQKYCQDKQYEAYRSLTSGASQSGVPTDIEQGIVKKCQSEWPDDYKMQKYCQDKQYEAYRALHR